MEKLAYEIYKRPIALFFLPEPPKIPPKTEFRTLPVVEMEQLLPDTRLHIRKAHAYQLALAEIFQNKNPSERMIWKDCAVKDGVKVSMLAKHCSHYLGVNINRITPLKFRKAVDKGMSLKPFKRYFRFLFG